MTNAGKIAVILLFTFAHAFASDPELERDDLVIGVRTPKVVAPGKHETFILEINNDFDFPLNLHVEVGMPSSWHLLSSVDHVQLQPGEKRSVMFLVDVDRACEIGPKNIRFSFIEKERNLKIEKNIVTKVQNIHDLQVRPLAYPERLMSGQSFEASFLVRNMGNCRELVRIYSPTGETDVKEMMLAPGTSEHVKVKQVVPDLKLVSYTSVEVALRMDSIEKPVRERISIRTFPKSTAQADPYHRFPIQASLIYFGASTTGPYEDGIQLEIEGAGALDTANNHRLYFKARGPNRFAVARVGNFDQYTLEYSWRHNNERATTFTLGDFAYNLTPITEMLRWARGVGVSHHYKKVEIGAFYNQPRFITEVQEQYAGYIKLAPKEGWNIQLSAMQKTFAERLTGKLISIRNELRFPKHSVAAEYAVGNTVGETGSAANLDFSGSIKNFSYTSQNIYAARYFPGYYNNSLFSNTNLRYRINKFMIMAGAVYNDANPVLDTIFNSSPYSTTGNLRFSYQYTKNSRASLGFVHRSKEDRFEPKKFSYRENAVRYRIIFKNRKWNTLLDGELARTENLLITADNNIANSFNVRGQAERLINDDLSVGGFVGYLYTNRYEDDLQAYLLYGANASYRLNRSFSASASVRNNYLVEEYYTDRSLIDVKLIGRKSVHQAALGVSYALMRNTLNKRDFYINARYTVAINTPLRKKQDLYSLYGQIQTVDSSDAAGIILHMAGKSVISDEQGRFIFNDLMPGTHYLYMDMGTINVKLISTTQVPMEVDIIPGRNNLNLELVRSGRISGKVSFYDGDRPITDKLPLRVVKVKNGDQELLTYTDEDGNFSFSRVLPGEWAIRIVPTATDSEKWHMLQNNIRIYVDSEEVEEVNFIVKKKKGNVMFKSQSPVEIEFD